MRRIVTETGKAFYSTGKRKNAIARVLMVPGDGTILVNARSIDEYFSRDTLKMVIRQPLELTSNNDKFDIKVTVAGGGMSSQAGAINDVLDDVLGHGRRSERPHAPARLEALDGIHRLPLHAAGSMPMIVSS